MFMQTTFSIAFFFLASLGIEAKIIETRHIEDVIPLIDNETWLLVDLDNCMFEGAQALGHANWFYDELQKRTQKGMNREEAIADAYPGWIKTQKVCKVKPLENSFVPTLLMQQNQGITIMGLTHRQPSVANSTVHQVGSLGFNFLTTAPSKESFVVPAKTPTLYFQGILFVGDYNKKIDIFEPFLSIIKMTPRKIVFIDDKRKNVEELESLTKYGIEYIGVHYTAIEHAKPVYVREVAEFQSKYLDQIMSNEAAILLMENGLE
ncbi:MAG: DUF2608 domain-containing protein [Parachlamydiaceae bacterium]|nr:DUF2608 domain-containing protein [Parachlamydiaceae bacterium]